MFRLLPNAPAGAVLKYLSRTKRLSHLEEDAEFRDQMLQQLQRVYISTSNQCMQRYFQKTTTEDANKLGESKFLVDWYGKDDSENPKNYSTAKKCFMHLQICLFTFTVYSSAAILTPAQQIFQTEWQISEQLSTLVLSMPLVGYALGPLIFSPLSEIPAVGRNAPYLTSFSLFIVFTIAGATVNNFPGLVVIRFLQGFLGSPVLVTGPASAGDLFDLPKLPYALAAWGLFAFGGPGLTPAMSSFAIQEVTWRWAMYETLILSGINWLLLVFCFPETNPDTILLRRARRFRQLTGRNDIISRAEIKQGDIKFLSLVGQYLTKPFKISLMDLSVGFVNIYTALLYSIFYTCFESFPLVFVGTHGFSIGLMGVAFLTLLIRAAVALTIYCLLVYTIYEPYTIANGVGVPEYRLFPGLFASMMAPIGVFVSAWTSREEINCVVPLTGSAILSGSCAVLYMLIFLYLPLCYPRHAASLFAANTFIRSIITAAAVHFAHPLFNNLGIAAGNSLLAGLLLGCFFVYFALWYWGAFLRFRSRFAETY